MITIRPMTSSDLPLLQVWLYAPHVAKWFEHPLAWLDEVRRQDDAFCWIHHSIVCCDARPMGFCQYYACADSDENWAGYTKLGGSYSIDYLIGEPEYLGRGVGRKIVELLILQIKAHEDAKRIVVQPDPANEASRGLLRACGFAHNEQNDIFVLAL